MKSNTGRIVASVMISGACLYGALGPIAARSQSVDQDSAVMSGNDEERRAAAARAKDAAWKPSSTEAGLIQIGDSKNPGALKNFCLDADGNLLTCYAPQGNGPKNAPCIRVYSPKGQLLKTLPLEIKPGAICTARDGSIFVAGDGRVLKLDAAGKVLASADSPVAKETVTITKETEEMVKQMIQQSKRPLKEELAKMKTSLEKRRSEVTGVAVTEQDLFMVVPAPSDFTFRVYRFNLALAEPKLVVEKLRGCCGQMDIQTHDGKLWIPHNARHSVETRDRDGNELSKFGKAGRVKATDFGGCCEPKNLRVLPNGDVLAAESGPPTCIKRFSASGKFMEVVALADGSKGDCVRVTVEMSPDGRQYYLLDTTRDAIRVFAAKH
ncbi:hypothetical protein [Pedosphaera parvula]|uniref:Uncharacterized protein n=1 Tax=Pedosphaera parvula (strain Ellin514) TaxID=320771 RepID=B9XHD7_PEDPL|nr:hypothetical protein [Pedosphaera parvula]EEF60772.1 hypothetical protein Cflav_PD3630 [Pedosphaera parvula Ellin514]